VGFKREHGLNVPRGAIFLSVLLAAGCQRAPADVSAVEYKIFSEATGETCTLCLLPRPSTPCTGDGEAAEVRWDLAGSWGRENLSIQVRRKDGPPIEIAKGVEGRTALPAALEQGDRISVVDASSGREMLYTPVEADIGCSLPGAPVGPPPAK